MQYETPKCPVCKQTSDRCPLRLVGEVGIMFELSEDGKSPVPVHCYLYQCTGCKSVFMVYGKLKPTNSPLDEVPLQPRPLREIPLNPMASQQSPPPGISLVAALPQKTGGQEEVKTIILESEEVKKTDGTVSRPAGKANKGTGKK